MNKKQHTVIIPSHNTLGHTKNTYKSMKKSMIKFYKVLITKGLHKSIYVYKSTKIEYNI